MRRLAVATVGGATFADAIRAETRIARASVEHASKPGPYIKMEECVNNDCGVIIARRAVLRSFTPEDHGRQHQEPA